MFTDFLSPNNTIHNKLETIHLLNLVAHSLHCHLLENYTIARSLLNVIVTLHTLILVLI